MNSVSEGFKTQRLIFMNDRQFKLMVTVRSTPSSDFAEISSKYVDT